MSPQPFTEWAERSQVPVAGHLISLDAGPCRPAPACVRHNGSEWVLHFTLTAKRHSNLTYLHEAGHLSHINSPEKAAEFAKLDPRCRGTFSYFCAERYADAFRNCADGHRTRATDRDPANGNRSWRPSAKRHRRACGLIRNPSDR